jgi:hypothetical protein
MFQKLLRKFTKMLEPEPDFPYIGTLTDENLEEYELAEWAKLDHEIQNEAIDYLKAELPPKILEEVKIAYDGYGSDWMGHMHLDWSEEERMFYTFHFEEGMAIRNLLRTIIKDNKLPTGNWDDYYSEALLRAAGCR